MTLFCDDKTRPVTRVLTETSSNTHTHTELKVDVVTRKTVIKKCYQVDDANGASKREMEK